ncbi:MAG: RIP metalloprotease RseP [Gammaproteobacteria bacterium RIFCSPHIGHO2_12_FULL_45_9]|nr:MAG: RIP metalloprotease RseP [Gammaproteobacteria bacterium RIFCSPHIGHO2_12_FULL_45_9]
MSIFLGIIGALIAILVVIVWHEAGHFCVAKLCGVKVLRFSIGFGRAIYHRTGRDGTVYALGWIPVGGYVQLLEEPLPDNPASEAQAFLHKPLWVRMAVILAGPIANFLLAWLVYSILFMGATTHIKPIVGQVTPHSLAAQMGVQPRDEVVSVNGSPMRNWSDVFLALLAGWNDNQPEKMNFLRRGQPYVRTFSVAHIKLNARAPDTLQALGMVPYEPPTPPILFHVMLGSPADKAGFKRHDVIKAINGQPITDWSQVVPFVQKNPGKPLNILIMRQGKTHILIAWPGVKVEEGKKIGFLGFLAKPGTYPPQYIMKQKANFGQAFVQGATETWQQLSLNAEFLLKMVTGQLSTQGLGGPISVFRAAGAASVAGLTVYLTFIAFLNITVGFVNLLPIPGLDGGHFLFQLLELVSRRRVPLIYQNWALWCGIGFLIVVACQATINDILRLYVERG